MNNNAGPADIDEDNAIEVRFCPICGEGVFQIVEEFEDIYITRCSECGNLIEHDNYTDEMRIHVGGI